MVSAINYDATKGLLNMISVTLQFPNLAEAVLALSRIDGTISPADRPDVGVGLPPPVELPAAAPASPDLSAVFASVVSPPAMPAAPALPAAPVAADTSPSAATAPTAAPGTVERDSAGMPYDSRIHAATRTKNADGTWRALRGVDKTLKDRIEAEHIQAAAVKAHGVPVAPALPVAPVAPVAPALPAAPVAPALPAVTAARDFTAYMAEVGPLFGADPAGTAARFAKALPTVGLSALGQLSGRPDLIQAVDAEFKRLQAAGE